MNKLNTLRPYLKYSYWGINGIVGLTVGAFWLTFIVFDVLWCAQTTFRGMSDISTYLNALLASLVLSLPGLLSRRRWVSAVIMLLLDLLLISNLMYCRTFMSAIPLSSYFMAGNLADFTDSVFDSMRLTDALLPLLTAAWTVMVYRRKPADTFGWRRYMYWGLVPLVISATCTLTQGGFMKRMDKMLNSAYFFTVTTPVYTVFGNILYDFIVNITPITEEQRRAVDEWMAYHDANHAYVPLPLAEGEQPRKAIVLILLESFETWPINATIEGKEITPYINTLVNDSTTFYAPRVETQVGAGRSIEAQLLINTGLLPMMSKVYSMQRASNDYPTLVKALKEKYGSSTHAYLLSPDKPYVWNQQVIARNFGFDTQYMEDSWEPSKYRVGTGKGKLPDRDLAKQIVERMSAGRLWPVGEPAFVQIVTFSGHNPFELPSGLSELTFSSDVPKVMARYLDTAHYTDGALKILVDYFKSRPDYDDMLIVITGDHEGLAGDRKDILSSAVGARYVDEDTFTPLIILNSPVAGRYEPVMGQVDIYTTILNLMHLDNYRWKGMGESVFNDTKIPAAVNSMTRRTSGDTSGLSSDERRHLEDARRISDIVISFDLLAQ